MADPQKIKVSVSRYDNTVKEIEESYEGSLTALAETVKNVRSTINEYLTSLVNEEKNVNINQRGKGKGKSPIKKPENDEESDVELEEDFVDLQIKQELSTRHGSGPGTRATNRTEKRTRSPNKNNKRMKF